MDLSTIYFRKKDDCTQNLRFTNAGISYTIYPATQERYSDRFEGTSMIKRSFSILLTAIALSLLFPLRASADVLIEPGFFVAGRNLLGLVIYLVALIVLVVITLLVIRNPAKGDTGIGQGRPGPREAPASRIKPVLMGIVAFLAVQVAIDIAFFFAVAIEHPFAFMANNYEADAIPGYFLVNGLMFVPIYFLLGMLATRVFKLKSKKSAITALLFGVVILSALWFFLVYLTDADYDFAIGFLIANIPAAWAYSPIDSFYDAYMSATNLFLTVPPPLAFAAGIWVCQRYSRSRV